MRLRQQKAFRFCYHLRSLGNMGMFAGEITALFVRGTASEETARPQEETTAAAAGPSNKADKPNTDKLDKEKAD